MDQHQHFAQSKAFSMWKAHWWSYRRLFTSD